MYCNAACKKKHRHKHKKECERRVAELHDEKLFKQPPPLEDCPICMIRLPLLGTGKMYMACCGKLICSGCSHAPVFDHQGNTVADLCPFCRTPAPVTVEEAIKRVKKRVKLNDPIGISDLGSYYAEGLYGLPQNIAKALELWHRAAELGHADAFYSIGNAYKIGRGVVRDEKKAVYYSELAAMSGAAQARHNLGCSELNAGNKAKALKHWMFAAKDGCAGSLRNIKRMFKDGHATKDDYANALRSYQAYLDEVKSDQRDEAAAAKDIYKYYDSILG